MQLKTQFQKKKEFEKIFKSTEDKDKGIYAITTDKDLKAMVLAKYLEMGVGDAGLKREDQGDIDSRVYGSLITSKYLRDDIREIGRWTDLVKIKRDYDIFNGLSLIAPRRIGQNKAGSKKRHEIFRLPIAQAMIDYYAKTGEYDQIIKYAHSEINKIIEKFDTANKTQRVKLRKIQLYVLNKIIKKLISQGFDMSLVAELAPRLGKTILFLSVFKELNSKNKDFKVMVIKAYGVGLSIFQSYKDEHRDYRDFNSCMDIIDSGDNDAEKKFNESQRAGRLSVILVSLNPEESNNKFKWIHEYRGSILSLLEETDFGVHTEKQVKKIEYLNSNKKKVVRINASGTNIGRVAKAMGNDKISDYIVVPYSMIEQEKDAGRFGIVKRRYYNMTFSDKINKKLENFDAEDLPTIKKIIQKPWAQERFLGAFWGDVTGAGDPLYGLNINQLTGEDIRYLMVFQTGTKQAMNQHKEVIEKYCPEVYVLVLHGDNDGMTNKTAQYETQVKIKELQSGMIPGKSKLIILTNMMGSRSYTVGEIQACLFLQDGGDVNAFIQKSSRVLSPHPGKKYGHIFDFAFDLNKTRNTEMAIVNDAVQRQSNTADDFPSSIRQVLNSVSLYDNMAGGWQSNDKMVLRLEDNNKLLAIADAVKIDIKTIDIKILNILLKIKGAIGDKKIQEKIKKIVKTGKTFTNTKGGTFSEKDEIVSTVKKAVQSLNRSATSVYHFANHKGNSWTECLKNIHKNYEASQDFEKVYGITANEAITLTPILPINILDVCIQTSKQGQGQKYVTNKALGILGTGDSKELWNTIISQSVLDARIKFVLKNNGKILIVAGGHGTEIDVLVEKYGKNIIKHIWFNDSIVSFANEMKRKYNNINILKGDFLSLNIDMKFDVIVGNYPYGDSDDSGSSLWVSFADKVFNLLKNKGVVGAIHPPSFIGKQILSKGTKSNYDAFKNYQFDQLHLFDDFEKEKYFKGVGTRLCWYIATKEKVYRNTKIVGYDKNSKTITNQHLPSILSLPKVINKLTLGIHKKIMQSTHYRLNQKRELHYYTMKQKNQIQDLKKGKYIYKSYFSHLITRYADYKFSDYDALKVMIPQTSTIENSFFDQECNVSEDLFYIKVDSKKITDAKKILEYLKSDLPKYIGKMYRTGRSLNLNHIPIIDHQIKFTNEELRYIQSY